MTFVTLLILWIGGLLWFATNINFSKPQDTIDKTEAIVVLTGGTKRIEIAVDLLKQGKASHLFISGVNPNVEAKDILPSKNKNLCCVTLGYKASNTKENAHETAEWISEQNIETIRLVTSNYHMMRAMLEFKKAMPTIEIIAHPVTPNGFNVWDRKFWPITFSEYNKTLLIWLQLKQA